MTSRAGNSKPSRWRVQKNSDGAVLFIGENWEEANEVAKLLTRLRGYNHNLLILVGSYEPTDQHDDDAELGRGFREYNEREVT